MSEKKNSREEEILSEFEGDDREIAKKLLEYRRPASDELRQRVMDITKQKDEQKKSLWVTIWAWIQKNLQ